MVFFLGRFSYYNNKLDYALRVKGSPTRQLSFKEWGALFNALNEPLTYMHRHKGLEMEPTLSGKGNTLLLRKTPSRVFVGDIVHLKDPEDDGNSLFRRVAATEGYEMVSSRKEEKPFVLEEGQCWVLSDNKKLNTEEARDSRWFGPVPCSSILGRVLYYLQSPNVHGPVNNSKDAIQSDAAILQIELDIPKMLHKHNS